MTKEEEVLFSHYITEISSFFHDMLMMSNNLESRGGGKKQNAKHRVFFQVAEKRRNPKIYNYYDSYEDLPFLKM